jgi:hypothetical protein
MNIAEKPEKFIRYYRYKLYLKIDDNITTLGKINTRNGCLTRQQKLKAVQAEGQWVII